MDVSENNVISTTADIPGTTPATYPTTYQYDEKGYPVKSTNWYTGTITYKYSCSPPIQKKSPDLEKIVKLYSKLT